MTKTVHAHFGAEAEGYEDVCPFRGKAESNQSCRCSHSLEVIGAEEGAAAGACISCADTN